MARGGYRGGGNNGSDKVCSFFQQGRCKFGANCRFDHPGFEAAQDIQPGGRRGAVDTYRPGQPTSGRGRNEQLPYHLDRDVIEEDLTSSKPNWPLSCYGPGRDAPRQLFEGEVEVSPEEARAKFYLARSQGNEQLAVQEEQHALNQITGQVQTALNNIDGAIDYVIQGRDVHPNRLDICEEGSKAFKQGAPDPTVNQGGGSTFGQPPTQSGFGQPSQPAFGQPFNSGSTFGKPASGQPSQPSTFGQPSQPSTFGQPSQPSAFRKPSQPSQPSAFGQPSQPAFGQPSNPSSTFGQPSNPTSAFGQPSKPAPAQPAFGRPSNPASAFGQPSKPGPSPFIAAGQRQGPPFAQASQNPSPFAAAAQGQQQPAQSTFGQPSKPSAFGQPSNPAAKPSPFAAAGQQSNTTFGAPTDPKASSPFGQPSAFGQPSQPATAFGQPSQSQTSTFGQPSQPKTNTFGQPSQPASQQNGFGQPASSTQPAPTISTPTASDIATPPISSYAQHSADGKLIRWKGHPVHYVPESRTKENPANVPVFKDPALGGKEIRIWSPDGPPEQLSKDVQAKDVTVYELGDLAAALKEVYTHVNATAEFNDGLMPEIPPKIDWIGWDV